MNKIIIILLAVAGLVGSGVCRGESTYQEISRVDLRDRIAVFWYGELVGNFMGYPFESRYKATSVPVLVDRYYDYRDAGEVNITVDDVRGVIRHVTGYYGGAVSDDDTDIELVTLHAVEKHGLDLTYPEITEMWKLHINRNIWAANAEARRLMDEGLVPPATGAKENNRHWSLIDPQLVNEIWSVFYPGMTEKAVARAEWINADIGREDTNGSITAGRSNVFCSMLKRIPPRKTIC